MNVEEIFQPKTSVNRISKLNPKLRESALWVYNECIREKIPLHIVCTTRSIQEQQTIYKYGRTIPGKVLTTNRPGYSAHNYGLALDFCLVYDGGMKTWEDATKDDIWKWRWLKVLKRFEEQGWESGWRWSYNWEPGHVQNLLGHTLGQLYTKHQHD